MKINEWVFLQNLFRIIAIIVVFSIGASQTQIRPCTFPETDLWPAQPFRISPGQFPPEKFYLEFDEVSQRCILYIEEYLGEDFGPEGIFLVGLNLKVEPTGINFTVSSSSDQIYAQLYNNPAIREWYIKSNRHFDYKQPDHEKIFPVAVIPSANGAPRIFWVQVVARN